MNAIPSEVKSAKHLILYFNQKSWKCVGRSTYLASKARAQMPAAKGAEADVPVWLDVQP